MAKDAPESEQTTLLFTLWVLEYRGHTCRAELWALKGVAGFDLRYLIDGELRETMLFRGMSGSALAIASSPATAIECGDRPVLNCTLATTSRSNVFTSTA